MNTEPFFHWHQNQLCRQMIWRHKTCCFQNLVQRKMAFTGTSGSYENGNRWDKERYMKKSAKESGASIRC
jgi:hypothetical protein